MRYVGTTMRTLGAMLFGLGLLGCDDDSSRREGEAATTMSADAGAGSSEASGNRAACESYVESYNALGCVPAGSELDTATACPASLDSSTCDASSYYECLEGSLRCMDLGGMSVIDTQGAQECGSTPCS